MNPNPPSPARSREKGASRRERGDEMARFEHWFRPFGIVRFLNPMIRVYRTAFRHFHLLLERRKGKDEQLTP